MNRTHTSAKWSKALLSAVLGTTLLATAPLSTASASSPIAISINGQAKSILQSPLLIEDRVYVPVRALLEAFGYRVQWSEQRHVAYGFKGHNDDQYIELNLQHGTVMYQDPLQQLFFSNAPMKIIDGRSLVSVRVLGEALGFAVKWNADQQTVEIDTSHGDFFEALLTNDLPGVRAMLAGGIDPNLKRGEYNLLHYAITLHDLGIAKRLVDAGATVQEGDLRHAVDSGDAELLTLLLSATKQTKTQAELATELLPLAVQFKETEVVTTLLALGADPHHQFSEPGESLLKLALNSQNTEIFQALLNAGSDPNGQSTVADDAHNVLIDTVDSGNLELTRLLLSAKADPNCRTAAGWTPLMIAAEKGNMQLVQTLLQSGADINATNQGATALAIAKAHGNTETANALLAAGAAETRPVAPPSSALYRNKEKIENLHPDPLTEAAMLGQTDRVGHLLAAGHIAEDTMISSLQHAIFKGNVETVQAFLSQNLQNIDGSLWSTILDSGNTSILHALRDQKQIMDTEHFESLLAEFMIFGTDNVPFYQTLLDIGFHPNGEFDEHTPLLAAARRGYPEVTRLLLQAGADPNEANHHGETALTMAVNSGHPETLKILLTADHLMKEATSNALLEAVKRDSPDMVKALLQAGADPQFQTADGNSPLQAAQAIDNPDVIRLLTGGTK